MKKFLTVLGIILAVVLAFNFLLIAMTFHGVDADNIAEIQVHNGLSGNRFTITEDRDIDIVATEINDLHPYLWFGIPGAGYVYYLQCFDASGNLICSLTIADNSTLIAGRSLLFADCTELRAVLEQLDTWNIVTD